MLVNADCLEYMETMQENSVDSVVTDPPYELKFMGNKWDSTGISFKKETWERCLRVLKPGGFLLAFGCPKNMHRIVCAIEDAGFKIVDEIFWHFGTGMAKGQNIGKAIEAKLTKGSANTQAFKELDGIKAKTSIGYNNIHAENDRPNNYNGQEYNKEVFFHTKEGEYYSDFHTQLKPACEVIVVAQKPLSEKTFAENVLKWGTGAFNIGACRIAHNEPIKTTKRKDRSEATVFTEESCGYDNSKNTMASANPKGRFPANVIFDEESAKKLDKQSGISTSTGGQSNSVYRSNSTIYRTGKDNIKKEDPGYGDTGGASRFFYCSKASKAEKNKGCEDLPKGNLHNTVKPISLMKYLVRLVTPPNGTVLDPFMGSGTTGIACKLEDFDFIGIEKEKNYFEIAKARCSVYE